MKRNSQRDKPTSSLSETVLKNLYKIHFDVEVQPPLTTFNTHSSNITLKGSPSTGFDNISNFHIKHIDHERLQTPTTLGTQHNPKIFFLSTRPKRFQHPADPSQCCHQSPNSLKNWSITRQNTPHLYMHHSFSPNNTTTTLHTYISQQILDAFDQLQPTSHIIMVAENIKHLTLSPDISSHKRYHNRWQQIQNKKTNNHANVIAGRKSLISKILKFYSEVYQGAIFSPTFFSHFLYDLPLTLNASHSWWPYHYISSPWHYTNVYTTSRQQNTGSLRQECLQLHKNPCPSS